MRPLIITAFLLLSITLCQAQSNFYLGGTDASHRIPQQQEALAETGSPHAFFAQLITQLRLVLDEQALSAWPTGEGVPRPGLLLFPLATEATSEVATYQSQLPADETWFVTKGAWLDQTGQWPPLLAGIVGAALQREAVQPLHWPALDDLAQTMSVVGGSTFRPQLVEPENLADPLTFAEVQAVAPAEAAHVLVLTVASPAEGNVAYEYRPVVLVFF